MKVVEYTRAESEGPIIASLNGDQLWFRVENSSITMSISDFRELVAAGEALIRKAAVGAA